ncbi:MAG: helix-turn-helix domain-containing protein [Methylobacter sp.]|uniref:helix-turn-helix domain-containing protein n=1 Tax=Methylobacter sp. TaxID=2051955 RepID=UPI0025840017|nr:helix-turn-helix domain-containing protein [Methylobacter sp.]MCL7420129.1 helix-turn-helix domain-containing protein [Methylobacter sp.]
MGVKPIDLLETDREQLQRLIKKGGDWRERNRAETILMLADGYTVKETAEKQRLTREAIRERRRKWLKTGFASLPDKPRSGAPIKLTDEHRNQLRSWIEAEPLTARALLNRLEKTFSVQVGNTTLRTELKRLGYVWKRTRYSLKKHEAGPTNKSFCREQASSEQ